MASKIHTQKSSAFLYTKNEQHENSENNPIYNSVKKNKVLRSNLHQIGALCTPQAQFVHFKLQNNGSRTIFPTKDFGKTGYSKVEENS